MRESHTTYVYTCDLCKKNRSEKPLRSISYSIDAHNERTTLSVDICSSCLTRPIKLLLDYIEDKKLKYINCF